MDSVLPSDDPIWLDGDIRPADGVRVTGRLNGAGAGRFYFSGAISGLAAGECRRCLVPVQYGVQGEQHTLYADADDESADEPDVFPVSDLGMTVDLRPAIREQWLLDATQLPLCRPDCKGLCPTCGAEWNLGPCACQTARASV